MRQNSQSDSNLKGKDGKARRTDDIEPVRLLSVGELAELLQVPTATVYQWRHRGEGPVPIRIGRHLRFHPADVASWIEERRAAS